MRVPVSVQIGRCSKEKKVPYSIRSLWDVRSQQRPRTRVMKLEHLGAAMSSTPFQRNFHNVLKFQFYTIQLEHNLKPKYLIWCLGFCRNHVEPFSPSKILIFSFQLNFISIDVGTLTNKIVVAGRKPIIPGNYSTESHFRAEDYFLPNNRGKAISVNLDRWEIT